MSFLNFQKKKNDDSKYYTENSQDQEKILTKEKNEMIQGIEDLHEKIAKEVMVPRIDVDFINVESDIKEVFEKLYESGHSRFPVYKDDIDNVIGVLYVKDIVYAISKNQQIEIEKIIRKPFFVPETKHLDSLLREFKKKHLHIAIAIDEYGGVSGIITMEDIIEEIVGDIQDEFDNECEDIISLGNSNYLCDARVNLSDLNKFLNSTFPEDDFDTLGGFVFDLFGKIPVKFEKISWKNFDFIIQDMDGHSISSIKIVKNSFKEDLDNEI